MTFSGSGSASSGYIAPSGAAAADFWRSGNGAVLPDGTTDKTDAIEHDGPVGIGAMFTALNPTARLEVAAAARTGVHGNTAATGAYVTGSSATLLSCTPAAWVGPAIAEMRHSNGTQGIGIIHDGLVATGTNSRQDMTFQTKGGGLFSHQYTDLYPGQPYNFDDHRTAAVLAQGQGFAGRWYAANPTGCNQIWQDLRIADNPSSPAGSSARLVWQGFLNGVGLAEAAQLQPRYACGTTTTPNGFQLFVDANRVGGPSANTTGYKGQTGFGAVPGTRKLVLFNTVANDNDRFYGLGINNGTLRYQIDGTGSFHRWYAATGACQSYQTFSVSGNSNVTIDPTGLNFDGRFRSGLLRFGDESSNAYIAAAAQTPQQLTGPNGMPAPYAAAPFTDPGMLVLGTAGAPRLSIAAGNPGVAGGGGAARFDDGGATTETAPTWSGWGATSAALVSFTRGAAGSQRPVLGLTFHNCGGPCSQLTPPVMAIRNVNGSPAGGAGSAGRVSWFNPAGTTEHAWIGGDQVGSIDLLGIANARLRAGTGVTQLITNGAARVTVRNNGIVNIAGLPVFLTDIGAGVGGLVAGDLWRDATGIVHAKL